MNAHISNKYPKSGKSTNKNNTQLSKLQGQIK